jgi:phosphohistidine phosphatase
VRLTLALMRHGAAAADGGAKGDARARDKARPLTARGQAEAQAAGRRLATGSAPTLVLASDAVRARQSAELAVAALTGGGSPAPELRLSPELYLGLPAELAAALAALTGDHRSILVVGHNPGISTLGVLLTGDYIALGTGEAAVLSVDATSWEEALAMSATWELC